MHYGGVEVVFDKAYFLDDHGDGDGLIFFSAGSDAEAAEYARSNFDSEADEDVIRAESLDGLADSNLNFLYAGPIGWVECQGCSWHIYPDDREREESWEFGHPLYPECSDPCETGAPIWREGEPIPRPVTDGGNVWCSWRCYVNYHERWSNAAPRT